MTSKQYFISAVDEFPEGTRQITEIEGKEIAVFNLDGDFYAVANFCPHQSGPLCEGGLMNRLSLGGDDGWDWTYEQEQAKYIVCPWHAWTFDITTGKNADDPKYAVPTYEVFVDDDEIYVEV